MQIELLYFDGCPKWEEAQKNMQDALAAEGLSANIRLVRVENNEEAGHLKFLGLSSFRVTGMDLWHAPRQRYNLSYRVDHTPQGLRGEPTLEMLREKLHTLPFNAPFTP